jgi:hypothetical protein
MVVTYWDLHPVGSETNPLLIFSDEKIETHMNLKLSF